MHLNPPVKSFSIFNDTPELADLSEMIFVEGGTFMMGQPDPDIGSKGWSKDEQPVHAVTLSDFFIGKYSVTQKLWREVMRSDPPELFFKGKDKHPVESVSWDDIQAFLKKLNNKSEKKYRLPTEAEWEYAARGGEHWKNNFIYAGGENLNELGWFGWYDNDKKNKNSHGETKPVGLKLDNQLGLFDMSGNVWEWCDDWYDENYYKNSPVSNPSGVDSGSDRMIRGGSWLFPAQFCRVTLRYRYEPTLRDSYLGFRLCFSAPPYSSQESWMASVEQVFVLSPVI